MPQRFDAQGLVRGGVQRTLPHSQGEGRPPCVVRQHCVAVRTFQESGGEVLASAHIVEMASGHPPPFFVLCLLVLRGHGGGKNEVDATTTSKESTVLRNRIRCQNTRTPE